FNELHFGPGTRLTVF
uniref:Uncharacterized protein n=1 Tax=Sarcophilus harrisii TaxID=9305 RepID=A0A7N4PT99_SARHA